MDHHLVETLQFVPIALLFFEGLFHGMLHLAKPGHGLLCRHHIALIVLLEFYVEQLSVEVV